MASSSVEDIPLVRLWSRRMTLAGEEPDFEDFFSSVEDVAEPKSGRCTPNPLFGDDDRYVVSDFEDEGIQTEKVEDYGPVQFCLNGATLKDIPAHYTIPATHEHEFPVVGVWIDKRVIPGFRYKVRPIQDSSEGLPMVGHFFGGRGLVLQSIGRGYSRRITFEADENHLNDNDNYFWSDSWPLGFAFEIEAVSPGDKFTLYDLENIAHGTLEVMEIMGPQKEVRSQILPDGAIEKTVRVQIMCKVEWFEEGPGEIAIPVTGLAVYVKQKGSSKATVTKIMRAIVDHKRGYNLLPGVCSTRRRITVSGKIVGDIPTKYTVIGLRTYEMPVIGTYVDPRILPGFDYRVRPCSSNEYIFNGKAVTLLSVGMGYGKRLTFAPDHNSLNNNDNYFWSDSHPDGVGFEPRAVQPGMKFAMYSGDQKLGIVSVFRADYPQQEIDQEQIKEVNGTSVTKYIHVEVTCNVTLGEEQEYEDPEVHSNSVTMRVSGTAVVTRKPREAIARIQRIQNIGLSSQLNVLFVLQKAELTFYPI